MKWIWKWKHPMKKATVTVELQHEPDIEKDKLNGVKLEDVERKLFYKDENGVEHAVDWTPENFNMIMSNPNYRLIFK